MMHLCYIYVYEYRALKNIDFSFDARYVCTYNAQKYELTIARSNQLPSDFWARGIYSITGVFGENGMGKSTLMSLLMEAIVEGVDVKNVNAIFVYTDGDKILYYVGAPNAKIVIKNPDGLDIQSTDTLKKAKVFYFSGHFNPENSDIRNQEWAGLYNGSTRYRLVKDYESYVNADGLQMVNPLLTYLRCHLNQNDYRICQLLGDKDIVKNFSTFKVPQYALFLSNEAGLNAMQRGKIKGKECRFVGLRYSWHSLKELAKANLIYNNILNLVSDTSYFDDEKNILVDWNEYLVNENDVFSAFEKFINTFKEDKRHVLNMVFRALLKLDATADFDEQGGLYYLKFETEYEKVRQIVEVQKKSPYLTSRYFDFHFAQELNGTPNVLSSGEMEFLNLFSRIYDAAELAPMKFANIDVPVIYLLDEAEIGYHPSWQLQYVKFLQDFLGALMVRAGVNFQVIIATHSPFLQSDIPQCCANYIRLNKDGKRCNVRNSVPETFGANMFNLYRESFFLNDGMIGQFAQDTINRIVDMITHNEDLEKVQQYVQLVGDESIRICLENMILENYRTENEVSRLKQYYRKQLQLMEDE